MNIKIVTVLMSGCGIGRNGLNERRLREVRWVYCLFTDFGGEGFSGLTWKSTGKKGDGNGRVANDVVGRDGSCFCVHNCQPGGA